MKITYQGQHIEAEMVNDMSGDLSILPDKYHCGDERILRDTSGRYYLWRCLRRLDDDSSKERQASGRTLTHRISVKAAALWAVARTNPQSRALRADLADLLSGYSTPGLDDLNHEAQRHLCEYVQSRGVDPRDALSGAVIMALSDSGLADDEAVEFAREVRLDEERDDAAPGGCIVRFTSPDGIDPWEVDLSAGETALIQAHADSVQLTFGEALKALIRQRIYERTLDVPGGVVTTRAVVLRDTYEAAGRYCAEHGRTVEESLAEMLKLFAEQAPSAPVLLPAADRSDCALCAAAKPAPDDKEDDMPLRPDDEAAA